MTHAVTDTPPRPFLRERHDLVLAAWCLVAACGAYFCVYGFRKPFTAASFENLTLWAIGYKTVLVTAQVLGYMLSKFIGIKVIAEMTPSRRAVFFVTLIAAAHAALLLFAVVPVPWNFACLFFNGLPLGLVFGLVLSFLEGRRQTEALTAALCASFIIGDGVTKSVGAWLLDAGVSAWWMPFTAGLLFLAPLLFFVWMLTRIPPPSSDDVAARSERGPMSGVDRWQFFRRYALGLTLLVLVYLLCTVLRSVRADFAPEIFRGLGLTDRPAVFAQSEIAVGLGVMLASGLAVLIRDNRRAFFAALALAIAGFGLVVAALLGQGAGLMSPLGFMVVLGVGLYLPYVVVHTTLFERLLAMTRDKGNIGYLMYLADAFGYLGYVAVMLAKNLVAPRGDFLAFFVALCWVIALAAALMLVPCAWYFAVHPATRRTAGEA